jgi:S-adenosylmethionine synthetase
MGIFIDTYGTSKLETEKIAKKVEAIFDMRPYFIEQRLKLNPIYSETAAYIGMTVLKHFLLSRWASENDYELFTWEN